MRSKGRRRMVFRSRAITAITRDHGDFLPRLLFNSRLAIVQPVKKLLLVAATVLIAAVAAHAANLTGTWNAKVDLGGQGGTPKFVLKQDGEKLTGTYSGALGDAPVTGSIKGNAVVFDFEASGAKVHYEGKLNAEGTTIEGSVDYGGQASGTFTATKQAEKK
jgi:hypothetical protein